MNTQLKKGLRSGLVFGIIFIFMTLIGFINVAANLLGELSGNLDGVGPGEMLPVSNLLTVMIVFGLLAGFSSRTKVEDLKWWGAPLAGLMSGLVSGVFAAGIIWLLGSLQMQEVVLTTYLPSLGAETVQYLLFYSTPVNAAVTYFIYMVLFGVLGAILGWLLKYKGWLKSSLDSAKVKVSDWTETQNLAQIFKQKWVVALLLVGVGAVLYFLPLAWGSYWNYIMGTVAIYIILGLGLNIIVGYSGQLVLGYVAFFATGAYTFALLTAPEPHGIGLNLLLAVLISVLVSTLTGLLLGLPILNLRGDYLAIVTLGFGEIVRILFKSDTLTWLTNGPKGVTNVGQPYWFGELFSDVNYMHLFTLLVLVAIFITKRLKDSRTGRAWIAIREDQTVAQATGISTYKYKILALLLGAAFAGLAGALFASRNQFAGPEDFTMMVSINVLCIVIVGGMGSLPGVVVGAFVLKGLPELLRELEDFRLLVFGALLVVMMIARPEGLWPAKRNRTGLGQEDAPVMDSPVEVES